MYNYVNVYVLVCPGVRVDHWSNPGQDKKTNVKFVTFTTY